MFCWSHSKHKQYFIVTNGVLTNVNTTLASQTGSLGTLQVSLPSAQWINASDTFVGLAGIGNLSLFLGAFGSSGNLSIAQQTSSEGTVDISDPGTTFVTYNVNVAEQGTAFLGLDLEPLLNLQELQLRGLLKRGCLNPG